MQTLKIRPASSPLGYIKNKSGKKCFNLYPSPTARPRAPDRARSHGCLYNELMKARVYVSMKPSVLDPQGQTICQALQGLGHSEIASVRQGKYFEIGLAQDVSRDSAARLLDSVAREVLSNPVIEEYRVDLLD